MLLAAAFLAMVLMGCVDGGGNNPGGQDGNGDGAGGLVGDWMVTSVVHDGEVEFVRVGDIQVLSFESSGGYASTVFERVGNFWIEGGMKDGEEHYGFVIVLRYNAVGSTLITTVSDRDGNVKEQDVAQYRISGDNLIMTSCHGGDEDRWCLEMTLTRVSISDVRGSLGTVYTPNPALYGEWVLQGGGGNESISFEKHHPMSYFYGDGRFIDAGENRDVYWCTDGDRLILVDANDYENKAELIYSVTGSGNDRTLRIGGDTWRIRGDSDDTGVQIPPDTITYDTIPRDTIPISIAKRPALFGYRKGK
jgi:hypothetical protein